MSDHPPARLWTLLTCQCLLTAGLALSHPFFALYLHRERGLPMSWVGAALFTMLAATGFGQALGGELADIFGSKQVMETSIGVRGALAVIMAWFVSRRAPALEIIILNVAAGFSASFYDSAVRSWIAAAYPFQERLVGYGKLRVALNVGWAIGPALGGMMAEHSYAILFAGSGFACFLCLALLHFTVPHLPQPRPESRFNWRETLDVSKDRRFLKFSGYAFFISIVIAQLIVNLSIHAVQYVGLNESQVGLLFMLNGLIVVFVQTRLAQQVKQINLSEIVAVGCILYAVGYGWVGFSGNFVAMAIAVSIVTSGEMLVSPGLQTLAANLAPDNFKGRYLGFLGLIYQIGTACGPLLGGFGLQYLSPQWVPLPWLLISTLAVLAASGFHGIRKELRQAGSSMDVEELVTVQG